MAIPGQKELVPLDEIESIQSWAMQSSPWRFFNVLLDVFTSDQLQRVAGDDNEFTIFEDISDILKLALWRPYDGPLYMRKDKELTKSAMTQVRHYIMSMSIPELVNKSMPFLTPKTSLIYLELVDQVRAVDSHLKSYAEAKERHYAKVQELHEKLLDARVVKFDKSLVDRYGKVYDGIVETFRKIKVERVHERGLNILRRHMLAYHKQVIAAETSVKGKEAVLQSSTFMGIISEQLTFELEEFQESVRDEAQSLMLCMAQRFFPAEVNFN